MQEMWVQSLGQEDPMERAVATHFSILAWEIPWTKEPGRLQSMGSQRVRHNLATKQVLVKLEVLRMGWLMVCVSPASPKDLKKLKRCHFSPDEIK